ncbi:MAG: peptidoglycan binding protein CsiV [Psychromonas sp.]|nr:peptidoglycan binding protein CsiV [Psychromonas sp.]
MNLKKLFALILILTSFSTFADTRWFTVEVLIFERNIDMSTLQETIPKEHKQVNTSDSIELLLKQFNKHCQKDQPCLHQQNTMLLSNANFNKKTRFQLVPEKNWHLTSARHALDARKQFTTVFHGAWRMPITSKNNQKTIHLFAGKNFALQELKIIQTKQKALDPTYKRNDPDQKGNNKSISKAQLAINSELDKLKDKWAIDGNIKIYLNHYLFIDSQLIVRRQDMHDQQENKNNIKVLDPENSVEINNKIGNESDSDVNTKPQIHVIKEMLFDQKEKLRSGKIYYFDHPLMGMIIQIRKN